MHSPDPRPSCFAVLRHVALILALGCLFAACDRHSAAEVADSYGHGSSHQKSFSDHQIDSRDHSASFSDTRGENVPVGAESPAATPVPVPTASPAPSPATSKFFQ